MGVRPRCKDLTSVAGVFWGGGGVVGGLRDAGWRPPLGQRPVVTSPGRAPQASQKKDGKGHDDTLTMAAVPEKSGSLSCLSGARQKEGVGNVYFNVAVVVVEVEVCCSRCIAFTHSSPPGQGVKRKYTGTCTEETDGKREAERKWPSMRPSGSPEVRSRFVGKSAVETHSAIGQGRQTGRTGVGRDHSARKLPTTGP